MSKTSSRSFSPGFMIFTALFISSLITSTLLGSKLVQIFGVTVSAGLFIFPFTFIANEMVAEVYGKKASRLLITVGIAIQFYVLFFVWLGGILPASPERDLTDAYNQMFFLAPRMVIASIVAYLVSQFLDLEVFLKVKEITHGRYLWLRANVASYLSQALDTTIFTVIFLGGILSPVDLFKAGLTAYLVKILVGTLDTPFVYLGVKIARRLDGRTGLEVQAVKTGVYTPDQNLVDFITENLPREWVREKSILAITSKIISLAEKAVVPKLTIDGTPEYKIEKTNLVQKESDRFIGETVYGVSLTVKHGILIPTAGIDESNSEKSEYILFPKDPYSSAEKLWKALKDYYQVKEFGIIITDSHTTPLRKGVTGIGLSHYGFKATRDLVGSPDLFGRVMKMTHVNVLDALSVAAVYEMGETNDACPMAMIYAQNIEFTQSSTAKEIHIPMEEDLYGKFF
jgi:uncharacterized integral membrane protein (TIGR00697 family)